MLGSISIPSNVIYEVILLYRQLKYLFNNEFHSIQIFFSQSDHVNQLESIWIITKTWWMSQAKVHMTHADFNFKYKKSSFNDIHFLVCFKNYENLGTRIDIDCFLIGNLWPCLMKCINRFSYSSDSFK